MTYSITQFGKPLDSSKYIIDEKNKVFCSNESYLVLDFNGKDDWTFKTGSYCTFDTGCSCTFKTGCSCTFKTGEECVVVRRDIYEIIEIPVNTKIELNEFWVTGYTIIEDKPITIDVPANANVTINGKVYSTKDILKKLGG